VRPENYHAYADKPIAPEAGRKEQSPLNALEQKLNYSFKDRTLLHKALTHSSFTNENRGKSCDCNERLEFLGDSVLGLVVATELYKRYPEMPEGRMTRLRAQLVCEDSLHRVALKLGLGEYIRLGKGEEMTGGRSRTSILADATEAVIAALYLDGGIGVSRDFIMAHIEPAIEEEDCSDATDCKTRLQELIQKKSGQVLAYELLSESGPDHDKLFMVQVCLNGEPIGQGSGRTKKEAEQSAASRALEYLKK
jgi:ribonuclease-3